MRFISKYANYSICYQRDITEHFATGESRLLQPLLNCQFRASLSLNPWEIAEGNRRFINNGTNVELDHVTLVDPAGQRYSVFDTEMFQFENGLTDEQRADIEQFLLNELPRHPSHAYGVDYLMVEAPKIPAPWPTYDDFKGVKGLPTADRIAQKVIEDGYDVQQVILYERTNQNRQHVIDALENIGKQAVDEVDPELLVSA